MLQQLNNTGDDDLWALINNCPERRPFWLFCDTVNGLIDIQLKPMWYRPFR